jgi:hypothetical protein
VVLPTDAFAIVTEQQTYDCNLGKGAFGFGTPFDFQSSRQLPRVTWRIRNV